MTSCDKFLPHFSDYLEGSVSQALKAEFESHLNQCENCRGVLHRMELLQHHMRQLEPVHTSDTFHIVLRSRIRRELEKPTFIDRVAAYFQTNRVPAYAASVALLLLISYGSLQVIWHWGQKNTQPKGMPTATIQSNGLSGTIVVQKKGNQVEERIHFILDEVPANAMMETSQALDSDFLEAFREEGRQDSTRLNAPGSEDFPQIRRTATVTF